MKRSSCISSSRRESLDGSSKHPRSLEDPPLTNPVQNLREEARCHGVVLETHPITETELISHLEQLWFSCGAEYQFLHSTSNPFDMPLLRFPPRDRPDKAFHPILVNSHSRGVEDPTL